MRYFWKLPPACEDEPVKVFPRGNAIIGAILAAILALALSAVTLSSQTLSMETLLWRLLAFPVTVALMVFTAVLMGHTFTRRWDNIARHSYQYNREKWQEGASVCLRLADHASLFTVDNAALKMLALAGEMPAEKDIPRKLAIHEDETLGLSRTQQVVTLLLNKLDTSMMNARMDKPDIWLHIRHADDAITADITTLLQQHDAVFRQSTVSVLPEPPGSTLLEQWVMSPFVGFRLLIVIALHGNQDEDFCEFATALLFSRHRDIPETRMPVWCFRSLESKPSLLGKSLSILLAAEQVTAADLRHVWTSNITGENWHLLAEAFRDSTTGVRPGQWHSMQPAATWTPGYYWLMLEWIAQAVRHGQRGQLMATQTTQHQQINLALISDAVPVPRQETTVLEAHHCSLTGFSNMVMLLLGLESLFLTLMVSHYWGADTPMSGWWSLSGILVTPVLLVSSMVWSEYLFYYYGAKIRAYYHTE